MILIALYISRYAVTMEKTTISQDALVASKLGIHARTAAMIAGLARKAKGDFRIESGDEKADAKSIMDILALACAKGVKVTLTIQEQSDIEALKALKKITEQGFGE